MMSSSAFDKFERIDSGAKSAGLFFILLVLGAAYILSAKLIGARAAMVTFVPVALMIGYALSLYFIKSFRLRDDQAGDNLYYMGFLFTLISLGASLYQFSAEGAAETIVQNFGVAVASTIAGVALRIVFTQMRRDPVDVERIARLELAEAARRMRSELDTTVFEMNHFRRATLQSMSEGFEAVRENVERISTGILASVEDVAKKSAGPIERVSSESGLAVEELTRRIVGAIEESALKLGQETDRLSKGSTAVTHALDLVAVRLAEMRTPDTVLEVNLAPITREFADTTQKLAEAVSASTDAGRDALKAVNLERAKHERSLLEQLGKLEAVSSQTGTQLKLAFGIFEGQAERNNQLSESAGQFMQRIDKQFKQSLRSEGNLSKAIATQRSDIVSGFESMIRAIDALGQNIKESRVPLYPLEEANAPKPDVLHGQVS